MPPRVRLGPLADERPSPFVGVAVGAAGVAASTLVIDPLQDVAPVDSLGVLYIPPVLVVAAGWGAWWGVVAAVVSALAYDYFYIPPVPSLEIGGRRNWATVITFLTAALSSGVVAALAARVRVAEARRRQELEVRARVLAAGDEERRRVARDMHDGAQQRLIHAVITLKLAADALRADERTAAEGLVGEALEHAEAANVQLRELAHGIMPAVLTRGGLSAALDSLASRVSVPVDVQVRTGRHRPGIEATAYFVVAEALTNVVKHAQASRANVRVWDERGVLHIEVRDDGVGGAEAERGSGLQGLEDRVSTLGGTLRVDSPPGGGTAVVATLPLA